MENIEKVEVFMVISTLLSKQYKALTIAAVAGTALVAVLTLQKRHLPMIATQTISPLCVGQACQNQADLSYQNALEAIRKEFNIPQEEWQRAHQEFLDICEDNKDLFALNAKPKTIKDELKNRIRIILADAGINPDKVSIDYTKEKGCPVSTFQEYTKRNHLKHSIAINKAWFTKHPVELQNAIINHEITHLKNFDCIEYGIIAEVLKQHGVSPKVYENSTSMQNFRHMRELRADLLAGARDTSIAQALHEDFCNCVARNYQEDLSSHPSSQMRLDQMTQLLNTMQIEPNIKLA